MLVHFRKIGPRRYSVRVEPEGTPALVAHPAPGYNEYLPHDLLHFVAEAEWGLDGAVFGQLAAGGDPGIFLPSTANSCGSGFGAGSCGARLIPKDVAPNCSRTCSNARGRRRGRGDHSPMTGRTSSPAPGSSPIT